MDIWSSGITLYAMLCGCLPFDEESKTALYEKILACRFPVPKYISTRAIDLLKGILVRDARKRLNVNEILNHQWCSKSNTGVDPAKLNKPFTERPLDQGCLEQVHTMMRISVRSLILMLQDNSHNEFTTLYYLLVKKKSYSKHIDDDGLFDSKKEVRFESSVAEKVAPLDIKKAQKSRLKKHISDNNKSDRESKSRSLSKNFSRRGSKNRGVDRPPLSSKRKNTSRDSSRGANGISYGFNRPPTMNLRDITVEVKEKITFSAKKSCDSKRNKAKERSGSGRRLSTKKLSGDGFKM